MDWNFLGKGNYNVAFFNRERTTVLKIQHTLDDQDSKIDAPSRSIRLWNEINSQLTPQAKIYKHHFKDQWFQGAKIEVDIGWTCPFISGREATLNEIKDALVEIYNRTGRVVLDAIVPGNFKRTAQGKVICIDIGMSFRIQKFEDSDLRKSLVSQSSWSDFAKNEYRPCLNLYELDIKFRPIVTRVMVVFVLQMQFPMIENVDFLNDSDNQGLESALAYELCHKGTLIKNVNEMGKLNTIKHEVLCELDSHSSYVFLPFNWKIFAVDKMTDYISSRGALTLENSFELSYRTLFFRDQTLTKEKISLARTLVIEIEASNNVTETIDIIKRKVSNKPHLYQGDLREAIDVILSKLEKQPLSCLGILPKPSNG